MTKPTAAEIVDEAWANGEIVCGHDVETALTAAGYDIADLSTHVIVPREPFLHLQNVIGIYNQIHDELDDGKEWSEIDNGLKEDAKHWVYNSWLGYMQQKIIFYVRAMTTKDAAP